MNKFKTMKRGVWICYKVQHLLSVKFETLQESYLWGWWVLVFCFPCSATLSFFESRCLAETAALWSFRASWCRGSKTSLASLSFRNDKVRSQRKKAILFGNFSQHGGRGGLPKSQNFCKFTKYFFVCQIHSEVLKHVLQMGGSDILSISTFNHHSRILKVVAFG